MGEINVRQATLADTLPITDIYCSTVMDGVFTRFNHDGSRTPASYETLNLFERYLNGGPWMSTETCAVWLAYLLRYGDEIPLVVVEDGVVRGEAEIAIGKEPAPYGYHLNINTLRVHETAHRRGLGSALIQYIKAMAAVMKVQHVLVADPRPSEFYQKHDFKSTVVRRKIIIAVRTGRVFYKATELTNFDPKSVQGWGMPFGRYQNARHGWIHVLPGFWNGVQELVETDVHRFEVTLSGQRGILVLEQDRYRPTYAQAYLWSERPLSGLLVSAIKDRAAQLNYEALILWVDDATLALLEGEILESHEPQMMMAWRIGNT